MDLAYVDKKKFQKMFGVYAKESREALGCSLADVARRTRISTERLRRIEAGQGILKTETVDVLMVTLGLSEKKMENLFEIARIGFIDEFMELSWAGAENE